MGVHIHSILSTMWFVYAWDGKPLSWEVTRFTIACLYLLARWLQHLVLVLSSWATETSSLFRYLNITVNHVLFSIKLTFSRLNIISLSMGQCFQIYYRAPRVSFRSFLFSVSMSYAIYQMLIWNSGLIRHLIVLFAKSDNHIYRSSGSESPRSSPLLRSWHKRYTLVHWSLRTSSVTISYVPTCPVLGILLWVNVPKFLKLFKIKQS